MHSDMEAEGGQRTAPSSSYYNLLGVSVYSSTEEIRRAYRKLAMQWHPDKWTKTPSLLGEAKIKFQQIQEAYSVLSDQRKRKLYDLGLYDPEEEDEEGFSDFVEELVSLMTEARREEKSSSMEDLQTMFMEMVQGFEPSPWFGALPVHGTVCSESTQWNPNSTVDWKTYSSVPPPAWEMYGASGYCR